jgi:hypothetical protein
VVAERAPGQTGGGTTGKAPAGASRTVPSQPLLDRPPNLADNKARLPPRPLPCPVLASLGRYARPHCATGHSATITADRAP